MNRPILHTHRRKGSRGFSLVEALAAVAIVGIVTFLALPNIVKLRADGEKSIAIARAEAFNMGVAAYVQSLGLSAASADWSPINADTRYGRVRPFLAFAPATLAEYVSAPYSMDVAGYVITNSGTATLGKVSLYDNSSGSPVVVRY
jgi:prepilin-type N-terminal cleavage/methylation domain-containing protein